MSVDKGLEGFVIEAPAAVTGTELVLAEEEEEEAVSKKSADTKKHSKKKKKRTRGQKRARNLVVLRAGDEGATRGRLHGASQTRLDLAPVRSGVNCSTSALGIEFSAVENERLPWKTRRILAMMGKGGDEGASTEGKMGTEKVTSDTAAAEEEERVEIDGQREGETESAYKKRVREEAASARKELLRGGPGSNRQKEKKRAYYERKKERAQRRKRRKRAGNRSDSEGEIDSHDEEHARNGGFWAEMLRERLENSEKSRKLRHRDRSEDAENAGKDVGKGGEREHVPFGEVVQRPPTLTKPVKR